MADSYIESAASGLASSAATGATSSGVVSGIAGGLSSSVNSNAVGVVSGVASAITGATSSFNFSVVKLEDTIKNLSTEMYNMWNELAHTCDLAGVIGTSVRSEDSNLADAWSNVLDAMTKFYSKLMELSSSYNQEIQTYIEETVALEIQTALNVEEIAGEINNISSQLDELFSI